MLSKSVIFTLHVCSVFVNAMFFQINMNDYTCNEFIFAIGLLNWNSLCFI